MTKSRFILRYRGAGAIPPETTAQLRELDDVEVLDESARMLLVAGGKRRLDKFLGQQAGEWLLSPENYVKLEDPRQKVRVKK